MVSIIIDMKRARLFSTYYKKSIHALQRCRKKQQKVAHQLRKMVHAHPILTVLVCALFFLILFLIWWNKKNAQFRFRRIWNDTYIFENTQHSLQTRLLGKSDTNLLYNLNDSKNEAEMTVRLKEGAVLKPEDAHTTKNPQTNHDQITVPTENKNITFTFEAQENAIKETIILTNPEALPKNNDQLAFSFSLNTKGMQPEILPDGIISPKFVNPETGDTYTLQQPYMTDAAGKYSENVLMTITPADDHSYTITIVPDMLWLRNTERTYPVSIDPTVVKGSAPIAAWNMNEGEGATAHDDSGNSNHLTMTNAQWRFQGNLSNPSSTFVQFDGSGDYLYRDNDADFSFGTGSFAISGWFRRPPTISSTEYIMSRVGSGVGFKVYLNGSGYFCFGTDDTTPFGPEDEACTTSALGSLADNRWHHFSAVKNTTSSIAVYIDGNLFTTNASLGSVATLSATATLYIGIDSDGSTGAWNGFLDNITVYNYAPTALQIKTDAFFEKQTSAVFGTKPVTVSADGLVGYWKMDETAANSCDDGADDSCDSSGLENDGLWYGNVTPAVGKFTGATTFDGSGDYIDVGDIDL